MKPMRVRSRGKMACLCLTALFVPFFAQALAEEPPKLSPLQKELEKVRGLISNSQIKLRRGVIGVAPAGTQKDFKRTPGNLCCGENIDGIKAHLEKIRVMMRDRGTCLERKWDRGGTEAVTMANQDLRSLATGIQAFSEAVKPEDTHGALDGTLRAYLNLKRRIDVLPPCSPGEPASKK